MDTSKKKKHAVCHKDDDVDNGVDNGDDDSVENGNDDSVDNGDDGADKHSHISHKQLIVV
eukprot:8445775-Ditylum_brightwellii.AAC.1